LSSSSSLEALSDCLRTQYPEMLIVNPTFGDYFDVNKFREETARKNIQIIKDRNRLIIFSQQRGIYKRANQSNQTYFLASGEEELDNQETLSQREKEIVICVVKGMTNKEIADIYNSINSQASRTVYL